MSKITSIAVLAALALVTVFTLLPEPADALTGSGTVGDPYVVWNVTDLQDMNNDLTAYYELGGDIDATATSGWNGGAGFVPIGSSSTPFSGFFDGKGYTITGLYINRTQDNVGLFGVVKSTAAGVTRYIRNVTLAGSYIGTSTSYSYSGTLIGQIKAPDFSTALVHISDVHVLGTTIRGWQRLGGLIGGMADYVTVQYCSVDDVNINRTNKAGGLIGSIYVSGQTTAQATTVYRCAATNVYISYDTPLGAHSECTGGLIGLVWMGSSGPGTAVIRECYSHGYIHAQCSGDYRAYYVGGLIGESLRALIYDCYALVSVDTVKGFRSGGFGGELSGTTVARSYSMGPVTSSGSTGVGGFVGGSDGGLTCTACFWDKETSGQAVSNCGTGKLTSEMKTETTFTNAGWDFNDVWGMFTIINAGYPHLRYNTTYYQSVWFQPVAIIEGTTLPNRAGYEDGIIAWGSNPAGITITQGLFTPETDYTFTPVIPDTLDIIDPEPGGMTSDMNLDRLKKNPLRPLAQVISATSGMTERLAWLGIAIFVLIALMIYVQLKTTHIVFTSLVGLGVATSFYLIGVFPLWVVVVLVFGLVGSIIYERMPVL